MDTYWIPGVNHLGTYGRWGFLGLTEVYKIDSGLSAQAEPREAVVRGLVEPAKVKAEFTKGLGPSSTGGGACLKSPSRRKRLSASSTRKLRGRTFPLLNLSR